MIVNAEAAQGDRQLRARTIDITAVESWEYVNENYVKVYMISGDKFIAKFSSLEFGDLMMKTVDAYGILFEFNLN